MKLEWAVQHRTTQAYLTAAGIMSPAVRDAVRFPAEERVQARQLHESLEDFASAWDVVPVVGVDWPDEFPGAWQDWPVSLQRVAAGLLVDYWLGSVGPGNLVKDIVCARGRGDLPYTARADRYWPLFLAHARVYAGAQLLKKLNSPPEPVT